jgi:RNA polymerase sigma-70 factor (ECF subfamily)
MNGIFISGLSLLCSRTDEEAMWRVKTRDDHEEFSRLVRRWEKPIQRLCARMTGDPARGDDLKQETFLRLFDRRKEYQPTGRFSTYLWRIALNLCYDELRRQQRRREFLRVDEPPGPGEGLSDCASEAPGPDARTAQQEEGELVRQALLRLPEIYRTVLVLRHYENLKLSKIAEILEIPEGTVNSRMAEALARLSRLLTPKLKPEARKPGTASRPATADIGHRTTDTEERRPSANTAEAVTRNPQPAILSRESCIL